MNIEYYNEYRYYKSMGIKSKTKECIEKFIHSFENYTEKESWTKEYLPKIEMDSNGRIRNELFEEIIFPVLWNGYNAKDIPSMMWLVKLEQNYYQNDRIGKKMNYKSSLKIIMECYEIDPNNSEVMEIYLEKLIERVNFSIHEWPSGVLFGMNFATKDECKILLERNELIRRLDVNRKYVEYIHDYENKTKEYMEKYLEYKNAYENEIKRIYRNIG
jgi:hypothetical protein